MGTRGTKTATSDGAGPTRTQLSEPASWERRPKLAATLRTLIALVPTIASFFVTFTIARYLPPDSIGVHASFWWIGLIACGMASLLTVDRTLRQLLPLVALLRLSLIFPDQAPSRFSVALRTGTTRQLERRIRQVTTSGMSAAPQEQAEHLLELVAALSRHDRMTRGHCERVRAYTDLLAEEMNLGRHDADRLRWAALAHDVGKVFVSEDILNSPNAPVGDDWDEIKSHTWLGEELVEPLRPWLGEWLDAVGQHHERWDGDGYPNGLRRDQIHLGARIVAVADAFDVMTSRRSYKKPMSAKLARAEIAEKAGEQFDPDVARALMNISIGRLRFAIGPLTWLFNVPTATSAALTPLAAPAITTFTAATTTLAAATIGFVPSPSESLALDDGNTPAAVVTNQLAPAPLPEPEESQAVVTLGPPTPPSTTISSALPSPTTTPPTTEPISTAPTTTTVPAIFDRGIEVTGASGALPTTTTAPVPTTEAADETSTTAPATPLPFAISIDSGPASIDEDGRAVFIVTVQSAVATASVTNPPTFGSILLAENPPLVRRTIALSTSPADEAAGSEERSPLAADGETTTFSATYTPLPDAFGVDSATLQFCVEARCQDVSVEIVVVAIPDAPAITPLDQAASIIREQAVDLTVAAADPDGDALHFTAAGLPTGLTIDATSGRITGQTRQAAGAGTFTVLVTDDATPPLTSQIDVAFVIIDAPPPEPYDQRLIISAARHHSSPGSRLIDEFVDITNISDEPINLAGVTLADFAAGNARDRGVAFGEEVDTSFHFMFPTTDRSALPSVLGPGATARIWISEPCGTTFTVGESSIETTPFPHRGEAATLQYSIDEANWHRLDLAADDLWLRTQDGATEDFVRWRSAEAGTMGAPTWWVVSEQTELAWGNVGPGGVVRFDHDRTHRTSSDR